jgi:hypothetical protein
MAAYRSRRQLATIQWFPDFFLSPDPDLQPIHSSPPTLPKNDNGEVWNHHTLPLPCLTPALWLTLLP